MIYFKVLYLGSIAIIVLSLLFTPKVIMTDLYDGKDGLKTTSKGETVIVSLLMFTLPLVNSLVALVFACCSLEYLISDFNKAKENLRKGEENV